MTGTGAVRRLDVASLALLVVPPLLWSTMIVAGRAVGVAVPPLALTFFTWIAADIVLLPAVFRDRRAVRAALGAHWRDWIVAGALGVALFQALYYLGLERTTAVNAALLSPTLPLMVAIAAAALLGERLGAIRSAGSLLGLAGATWIAVGGDAARLAEFDLGAGDLYILGANAAMTAYTLLLRARPNTLAPTTHMGVMALVGTVLLAPAVVWESGAGRVPSWSAASVTAVIYIGVATYALGYVFWNMSVARVGATLTAIFLYLIPPLGIALASMLLGEPVASHHFEGAGLIFAGIFLCLHGPAHGRPGSIRPE